MAEISIKRNGMVVAKASMAEIGLCKTTWEAVAKVDDNYEGYCELLKVLETNNGDEKDIGFLRTVLTLCETF